MTKTELRQLDRLIKKLADAQGIADNLEITIGNVAEVGSIVGSLRYELQVRRDEMRAE